jgi:hypothetical protein
MKACKTQGFVWWDAGWRIKFDKLAFPVTGYIWTTADQQVTHVASIESGSRMVSQSDKMLAREVEANWNKLGLPFNINDPLHKYLRNERETLTLLKLSEIEELNPPKGLGDFTLWNGRPVLRPPQGCYRIALL